MVTATDSANIAQLTIPEGVLLGHALVSRVADSLGIRAFFIKGPASVTQGLRQPRTSADVDVFVDPSCLDEMLQGLRERGWRDRPVDADSFTFPKHSITVDHPDWPCCIDVHYRFPGMERDTSECFEAMWANTEELELGGQQVRVPSKPLGILFLALHALRSSWLPASRRELDFLAELTERQSLTSALLEVASATGSLAAVRPFVEPLLPPNAMLTWPLPSKEWHNRLLAREPGSARLIAILHAPWQQKAILLWRAVFPRPEVFLSGDIYADMSFRGRLLQHRARWAKFLRSIPNLAQDLYRFQCEKLPLSTTDL